MAQLQQAVETWLVTAETHLQNGGVTPADLQQLRQLCQTAKPYQRLLYLHARTPSIYAPVIGMAQHEPQTGQKDILRTRADWPYETVHDAIIDGWQVIHFPNLLSPYDDRELDYVGFEFILQKMEMMIHE